MLFRRLFDDHLISVASACFREKGHAYGINEKGYMFINTGKFEDDALLNAVQF